MRYMTAYTIGRWRRYCRAWTAATRLMRRGCSGKTGAERSLRWSLVAVLRRSEHSARCDNRSLKSTTSSTLPLFFLDTSKSILSGIVITQIHAVTLTVCEIIFLPQWALLAPGPCICRGFTPAPPSMPAARRKHTAAAAPARNWTGRIPTVPDWARWPAAGYWTRYVVGAVRGVVWSDTSGTAWW